MKKMNFKPSSLVSLLLVGILTFSVPFPAFAEPGEGAAVPTVEGGAPNGTAAGAATEPGSASPADPTEPETSLEAPGTEEPDSGVPDASLEVPDSTSPEDSQETPDVSLTEPEEQEPVEEEGAELGVLAAEDFNNAIVVFASALDKQKCLDIPGLSTASSVQVILWTAGQRPNQRFKFVKDSDGYYTITNIKSNLVLDVSGGTAADAVKVIQYKPNGGNNQKWKLVQNANGTYTIVSKLSGETFCLDLYGNASADETPLIVYPRGANKPNQQFYLERITPVVPNGTYTIQSEATGAMIDIYGRSFDNDARVIGYAATGGANQRFVFTYNQQTGYYQILSVNSNKPLDVKGAASADGTPLIQYESNGAFNQQWNIEKLSNGSYCLYAAFSGKAVDLTGAGNVIVWSRHGGANQRWKLNATALLDTGVYNLISTTGFNMDVYGASEANDAEAILYDRTTGLNQKFQVRKVDSSDVFVLEAVHSGKLITAEGGTSTRVSQYAAQGGSNGNSSQRWKAEPAGNGSVRFQNVATGTYLDYGNGSSSVKLQVAPSGALSKQSWTLQAVDLLTDGVYSFASALNSSLVLDIAGGSTTPGTFLALWADNGGANQRFRVAKVGDKRFNIISLTSSMALDVEGNAVNATTGAGKVLQWTVNGAANQMWDIQYVGGGTVRFVSALKDGMASMTVTSNSPGNGTAVGLLKTNNSAAQAFKPRVAGSITYYQMSCTLDQFTDWQYPTVASNYPGYSWSVLKTTLDPNSKTGAAFLQFVDVRIGTGVTGAQLNAYIDSTTNGRNGVFHGRGQAFVDAANKYGLNEVYFLTHACLESAWGTSNFAKGSYYDGVRKIDGKTYPAGTYYNFWGIGAYDSNPNNAIDYAVVRGWNSPEAAIDGSANWIALNYVYDDYAQPSVYAMRWDYARANAVGGRGWHQYATSTTWANTIPMMMSECYSYSGVSPKLYYVVPRFK